MELGSVLSMRFSFVWPALLCAPLLVISSARDAAADGRSACSAAYEGAQRSRLAGRVGEARAELLVCVSEACPAFIRSDCVTWLAEVEAAVPTVVFAVIGPDGHDLAGAAITVDGRAIPGGADGSEHPVDPGPHVVRSEFGGRVLTENVVIRSGEKRRRIEFRLEPPPTPSPAPDGRTTRPTPPAVYVAGGVALGFLATAVSFWAVGHASAGDYNDRCMSAAGCSADDRSVVRRELAFGDIAFVIGAGAGALASYLFFTRPREPIHGANITPTLIRF